MPAQHPYSKWHTCGRRVFADVEDVVTAAFEASMGVEKLTDATVGGIEGPEPKSAELIDNDDKGPCRRRARAAQGQTRYRAVRPSGAAPGIEKRPS